MIFNVKNDNIMKIFLSNGDNFTVDTYEGFETKKITYNLEPDSANYVFSFWAEAVNGEGQTNERTGVDYPIKIVGRVDQIVAVETMDILEKE
tara:strand:+ start:47 stop:322 length:276 start_codon:yes stop_codon:yes gene_type:complete